MHRGRPSEHKCAQGKEKGAIGIDGGWLGFVGIQPLFAAFSVRKQQLLSVRETGGAPDRQQDSQVVRASLQWNDNGDDRQTDSRSLGPFRNGFGVATTKTLFINHGHVVSHRNGGNQKGPFHDITPVVGKENGQTQGGPRENVKDLDFVHFATKVSLHSKGGAGQEAFGAIGFARQVFNLVERIAHKPGNGHNENGTQHGKEQTQAHVHMKVGCEGSDLNVQHGIHSDPIPEPSKHEDGSTKVVKDWLGVDATFRVKSISHQSCFPQNHGSNGNANG
mmetsp:Transcript_9057/g.25097  ORF Transcript_9057/g.25097 Transcript_9057/m.25097 type:complete len:277 (-) Transcript_9057:786-1616(-)